MCRKKIRKKNTQKKNLIVTLFVFHQIEDKGKVLPTEDKTELMLQASEAKKKENRKAPQITI